MATSNWKWMHRKLETGEQISNCIIESIETSAFPFLANPIKSEKKGRRKYPVQMFLSLDRKVENHGIITVFSAQWQIKKYDFECDETEVMILLRILLVVRRGCRSLFSACDSAVAIVFRIRF